jgi:GDP-D-mannose 3', 5'-epimerase
MKRALVCGAGGFIGHHLVTRLTEEGYWVRGVDIKHPEFENSKANEFQILDLRIKENCEKALTLQNNSETFDEVYQLAANMGGMGFIHSAECEIMLNSSLINLYMIDSSVRKGVPRYFFSSSACVYKNQLEGDDFISEDDAYPALPDNEYGWEKLYAERTALAYGRNFPIEVRVARFQNCYGPMGTWRGGKEKAPAALCRKVAEVEDGGTIEIWGDGTAMRSFVYYSDLVDGVRKLMSSDIKEPVNIGSEEFVSVTQLVDSIERASGKTFNRKHIDGPVGVQARNHTFNRIKSLDWNVKVSVDEGIGNLYKWIAQQVEESRAK